MTGNLPRRAYELKEGLVDGFTNQYDVKRLVHIEAYDDPLIAIEREKKLKKWKRAYKIALVEEDNPEWRDLYEDLNA